MPAIIPSILLLAGGRGQRMGGQDKGLLPWHGQPLIAHLQRTVRPLSDDLIISCNRNHEQYAVFADQLVSDDSDDFPGPLAGIRAGLKAARHSHLLVLPCDVPNVDGPLLMQMLEAVAATPQRPLMIRHGEHWEPLLCIIPCALGEHLERAWHAGERSPRSVLLRLDAQALNLAAGDARLDNLNTPTLLHNANPPPDLH